MKIEDQLLDNSNTEEDIPTKIIQSDHLESEFQYCSSEKSREKLDTILNDCSNTVCKSTIQKSDAYLSSGK